MSYNRVVLLGNLTRDPEMKEAGSSQVCKFSLAVNRKYKNQAGLQEEVCFVDCEAWSQLAEVCHSYLKKGSSVLLEGRLKQSSWTTEDGSKRSKHVLHVENMTFVGGNKDKNPTEQNNNMRDVDSGQNTLPF